MIGYRDGAVRIAAIARGCKPRVLTDFRGSSPLPPTPEGSPRDEHGAPRRMTGRIPPHAQDDNEVITGGRFFTETGDGFLKRPLKPSSWL